LVFFIDTIGTVNTTGYVLAAGFTGNNSRLSVHTPQLIWAPQDLYYLLLFQIDLDGPQQLVTDIVFAPIDPVSLNPLGYVSVGSNLPRNRNAFVTYASRTNDFLVVLDADTPGSGTSNIYGAIVAALTGTIRQRIVYVNQVSNVDHHARSAYSTIDGQFLVVWNNGTEPEDNVSKRYMPELENKSVPKWRNDVKFESGVRSIEVTTMYSEIEKMDFDENKLPTSIKRQTPANFLKGVLVCAPSSGSTSVASPINLNSGGGSRVALIASLTTIFGVLAIVGVIALIYFLVARRRAKSRSAMRFDPDNDTQS